MKKTISVILLISLLILMLSSCDIISGDISSVRIDDSLLSCHTVYLYAFKNAKINSNYESETSTETPTSSGFIYSREKLKVGDSIKVWQDFKFGKKTSSWPDNRQSGTEAVVAKIVDKYEVKVKNKGDTYIITYYTVDELISHTTVTNRENLAKIEKHKIEVVKDKVIIEYDV